MLYSGGMDGHSVFLGERGGFCGFIVLDDELFGGGWLLGDELLAGGRL